MPGEVGARLGVQPGAPAQRDPPAAREPFDHGGALGGAELRLTALDEQLVDLVAGKSTTGTIGKLRAGSTS